MLNQVKSPLTCIQALQHSNRHLIITSNTHLSTSDSPIAKRPNLRCSKHAPMYLQHEAPQKLLRALGDPLANQQAIKSLTLELLRGAQ